MHITEIKTMVVSDIFQIVMNFRNEFNSLAQLSSGSFNFSQECILFLY